MTFQFLSVNPATAARLACVLAALANGGFAWGQKGTDSEHRCPNPASQLPSMTYDEQVAPLADPACRTGLLDRIRFIPLLREDNNYYLSFGFWIRERGEYESNPNWSHKTPGNVFQMQRYFFHTDVHLGDRFRFFGEIASSVEDGRNGGRRALIDEEKLYVHQGFFDVGIWRSGHNSVTLRAGRQEVSLGSQLLVSTRDGRNIRRALDGARLSVVKGDWTVDLFALKPVLDNPGYFDDPPNHSSSFWAVYAVHPFAVLPHGHVDAYYMGLDNRSVVYDGKGTHREQRQTVGTRLWGTTSHWDYGYEPVFQWGNFGSNDIRAWGVSTDTGFRVDGALFSPRFGFRADAFSGDSNPSGQRLGTFSSIYEKGPYYSYAELFARRNLVALQPSAALHLRKSLTLTVNPAFFWRESTSDGLYSISNAVTVSGLKANGRYIATQASTQLQWKMTPNFVWFTEFGHFFPGEFLRQATPGRNLNYWTGWLDIRY